MAERRLPAPFHDLELYLAWALPTERERSAKRQASTMTEIKAFYDAMMVRMEEVLSHLAQFSPENVPADVQRLFYLTLSLAEVAPAVENFGQPSVIDGYDAARFIAGDD
ncbi:MAG: hypothetical protein ACRERD_32130 [Candidatus Binatia bacterium]